MVALCRQITFFSPTHFRHYFIIVNIRTCFFQSLPKETYIFFLGDALDVKYLHGTTNGKQANIGVPRIQHE